VIIRYETKQRLSFSLYNYCNCIRGGVGKKNSVAFCLASPGSGKLQVGQISVKVPDRAPINEIVVMSLSKL